jgi:hypothetical protein
MTLQSLLSSIFQPPRSSRKNRPVREEGRTATNPLVEPCKQPGEPETDGGYSSQPLACNVALKQPPGRGTARSVHLITPLRVEKTGLITPDQISRLKQPVPLLLLLFSCDVVHRATYKAASVPIFKSA